MIDLFIVERCGACGHARCAFVQHLAQPMPLYALEDGLLDYSDTEAASAVPSAAGSMMTLFIGLVIVFALIAGCAFAVRIWQRGGISKLTRQRHMSLVETLAFGPKRSVALVTVGGKALVLGCGESDIRMLHSFDASDLEEELIEDFPDPGASYETPTQAEVTAEKARDDHSQDRVSAFKKRLERTLTGKGDDQAEVGAQVSQGAQP